MSILSLRRLLGPMHSPYVVAACDPEKLGSLDATLSMIDAAVAARCDAVKLATLPWDWCARVFDYAERRGMTLLARASDERSIERLDWLGASAFEIFFDWSDYDLVACAARTGKPVLLSVANATSLDVAQAVAIARGHGSGGVALIQRVMDASIANLDTVRAHGTVYGISDRSTSIDILRSAIRGGASIVEKRVAPRHINGDLATFVRECELAWALLGNVDERWATLN